MVPLEDGSLAAHAEGAGILDALRDPGQDRGHAEERQAAQLQVRRRPPPLPARRTGPQVSWMIRFGI